MNHQISDVDVQFQTFMMQISCYKVYKTPRSLKVHIVRLSVAVEGASSPRRLKHVTLLTSTSCQQYCIDIKKVEYDRQTFKYFIYSGFKILVVLVHVNHVRDYNHRL